MGYGRILVAWCLTASAAAQTLLDDAYAALRVQRYLQAAALFETGLARNPAHATARKDYAYTLLRLGETEAARDQFLNAYLLNPNDFDAALEYGFLCFETRRKPEARQIFEEVRRRADGSARMRAEMALSGIDASLKAGFLQWSEAARRQPASDSIQEELAKLAEESGDHLTAARHYQEAFRLKPARRQLLLDLGRVREASGDTAGAQSAYIAAARSPDIRTSELARDRLRGAASPEQLTLARALEPRIARPVDLPAETVSILDLADRSFERGYLRDAGKYYREALDSNPENSFAKLRLGWISNIGGDDRAAYRWFGEARSAEDRKVAREARQAWRSLREGQAAVRPTLWLNPLYSTRWHSAFAYGQAQAVFRFGKLPLQPYLSARFSNDFGATGAPAPLSERALTPAAGIRTRPWRGVTGWFEAGGNFGNIQGGDLRGGLAHYRAFGSPVGAEERGWFYILENSVNYASRFGHDTLFGTRHRAGFGGGSFEAGWVYGVGIDSRRQYWANYLESGPSFRVRIPKLPRNLLFTVELVRGWNFIAEGNPRRPVYHDARIGFWYAITY